MGLDMFLRAGGKEIGYWRKHPNLHGYIVNTFANGVDECQPIPLSLSDVNDILHAIENDLLPHTVGFFFGTSRPEHKAESLNIFGVAKKLLEADWTVELIYQSSW